jgi:hypothetical protein
MASNDQQHFAFLRNGRYLAGKSDRLEKVRSGGVYDLTELSAFR